MSNNQWRSKGNSYWISPTLGVLIGQKIRIVCENFSWNQALQGNGYIWSQVTAAAGTREFSFFMNQNGPVEVFYGGVSNIVLMPTKAAFFGTGNGSVTNILFDFEIDTSTGAWTFTKDGVLTSSGTVTLNGTARVEGQEFWVGGRQVGDTGSNRQMGAFMPPNNAIRLGNTRIYINDTLAREFIIPSGTDLIIPDTVAGNDALLYGPTAGDGLDYVSGLDVTGEGGLTVGGEASYSFEAGEETETYSYTGQGGFSVGGSADVQFESAPLDYTYTPSGGLSFGGVGAYQFQPVAKAEINNLLAFGASNMVRVFDVYPSNGATVRDDLRFRMRQAGFDLPFLSYAVGNHAITTTNAMMNSWLANHSGLTNGACLVHTGGVNVTNNGPWSTWTEPQKDIFYNALEEICQKIVNAGFELILCPLTYRRYSYALVDEDEGSKSVNENLIHPLIRQYCPRWWNFETGKPVVDLYAASFSAGLGFFASGDDVHPVYPGGVEVLQNEVINGLMERGILPEVDPRKTISVNLTAIENRPPGTNNITALNGSASGVRDTDGDAIPGSSVSFSGYSDIQSVALTSALRNFLTPDATHFRAVTRTMETSSSGSIVIDMGEDYAGRTGEAKITGYSGPPVGGDTASRFSTPDGFDEIESDQTPPQVATVNFQLDALGAVTLDHTLVAGSSTGYFSAIDLILNAEFSTFEYTGDGGLSLGGAATVSSSSDYSYSGSGGLSMGGSASVTQSTGFSYTATGGVSFSGEADYSFSGSQSYSYSASGGLSLGGAALYSFQSGINEFDYSATGGLSFGGQANYSFSAGAFDFQYLPEGGLYLGGQADHEFVAGAFDFQYLPEGGLYIGGSIDDGFEIMAYGTNSGFATWLATQGLALPEESLPVGIIRQIGSDYVDAAYGWRLQCSHRTGGFAQIREWPRAGHQVQRQDVPDDLVPHAWIQASYRAAYLSAVTPGWTTSGRDPGRMTKTEKVDVISREFFKPEDSGGTADVAPGMPFDSVINALVTPWLCPEKQGRDPCSLFRVV